MSEHTDAARLEATRDAIRTGTAPRPRVEGEAAWLTMDEHEAQGYDLPKRAVGSKSHWLAMADRWTVEAKAQRAERARLTAEVERLRGVVWDAYIEGAVHNSHDCVNWYKSDACAALALRDELTEEGKDGS